MEEYLVQELYEIQKLCEAVAFRSSLLEEGVTTMRDFRLWLWEHKPEEEHHYWMSIHAQAKAALEGAPSYSVEELRESRIRQLLSSEPALLFAVEAAESQYLPEHPRLADLVRRVSTYRHASPKPKPSAPPHLRRERHTSVVGI